MPGFLSKVFGRGKKREDKHKDAPASPLGGKFEDVQLSPTATNSHENGSKATNGKERTSPTMREVPSKEPTTPHLSLNFPGAKEPTASRELGAVFEAHPDSRVLLPENLIGERQLNPVEALVLLKTCGQAIVERGLETLGLMHPHWHSASPGVQRKLVSIFIQSLDPNSPKTSLSPATTATFESEVQYTRSPHDVAAVFRWGLRHLQFKDPSTFGKDVDWYSQFYDKERSASHPATAFSDQLAPLVPTSHLELLKHTLETISYIAAHAEGTGVSGSRLTKFIALWLLDPQGSRTGETWSELYEKWEKAGRMLEHLFLANIRDEAARHQMPLRLTRLTTQYPYGPTADTSLLPPPRFTTRAYDALLITLEVPFGSDPSNIHPVKLVSEIHKANAVVEDDTAPEADLWAKIKSQQVSSEAEGTSTAVPPLSSIFSDETIRLISLIPADLSAGTVLSTSGFNLHSPTVTRRRSSSLRAHPPTAETPTQSNGNGHKHQQSVSSISGSVSERPSLNIVTKPLGATDWGLFSQSGFLEDSTLGAPLAATLMDRDVETTSPPAQPARRKSAKKNRRRQSLESPAPASPSAVSPSPPTEEQSELEHSNYRTRVIKVDEAFIDFWSDSLTDPISSRWPNFFIYRLKKPIEQQSEANQTTIEWIVLERTIAKPPPLPPTPMEPVTPVSNSSHVPTSAGGATPTRPRAGSPKPSVGSLGGGKSRFSIFSSVSSLGKSNPGKSKRSASTKKGSGTPKIGEMGEVLSEETEGRRSMTVSKAPEEVPIPESPMVETMRPLPPSPGEEVPGPAPVAAANPPPAAAPVSAPATQSEDRATDNEKKESQLGGVAMVGVAGLAAGGALFAAGQYEEKTQEEAQATPDSAVEQTAETKLAEETLASVPGDTTLPDLASTQKASPAPAEVTPSAPAQEVTPPAPAEEVTLPAPTQEVTPPALRTAPESESESPTTRAAPPAPLNLPPAAIDVESTPVNDEDDEDQEDPTESPVVDRHSHMVMAAAAEKYHDKAGHERVVITPCASAHEDDDPMDEVDDDEDEDDASLPEQPSVGASTIIAPTPVTVEKQDATAIDADNRHLAPVLPERAQADITPTHETSEQVPDVVVEQADGASPEQPPTLEKQDSIFTSAVPVGGHTLSLQEAIAHAEAHSNAPSPMPIPEPSHEDSPEAHVGTEVEALVTEPTFTTEQPTSSVRDEAPKTLVSEPVSAGEEAASVEEDASIAPVFKAESASNAEEAAPLVAERTPATEESITFAIDQSPTVAEPSSRATQESTASVEDTPEVVEVTAPHATEETLPKEEKITEERASEVVAEPELKIAEPDQVVEESIVKAGEAAPLATASTMKGAESAPIDEEVSQPKLFGEGESVVDSDPIPVVEAPTEVEEPVHMARTHGSAADVPEVAIKESAPKVEEPSSVAEAFVPHAQESVLVVEALPSQVEEPNAVAETAIAHVEEPAQSVEESSAHVEELSEIQKPTPVEEEPTQVIEESSALPAIVGTTLATSNSTPTTSEPAAPVDKATSSIQESSAAAPEAPSDAAEQPTSSFEQSAPRSEDTMVPPAQETAQAPFVEEISTAPETTEPVVAPIAIVEAAPAAEESTLATSELSSVAEAPTIAASGHSPAVQSSALPVDADNDIIDANTTDDAKSTSILAQAIAPVDEVSPSAQEGVAAVEEPTSVEDETSTFASNSQVAAGQSSDDVTPVTAAAPSPFTSPIAAKSSLPVVDTEDSASALPEPSVGTEQGSEPAPSTGSDDSQQFVVEKPTIEPLRVSDAEDFSQDSTELPPVPVVDVAPVEASPVLMPKPVETSVPDITPAAVEPVLNAPATEVLETGSTPGPELALSPSATPSTPVLLSTEGITNASKEDSFDTEPSLPNADSTPKVEEELFLPPIINDTLVDDRKPSTEAPDLPSADEALSKPEESSPVALPAVTSAPAPSSDSPADTKATNA